MTVLSLVKRFSKTVRPSECVTDNSIFQFHYKLTAPMLLIFSVVITAKQYIGDPIDCFGPSKKTVKPDILDSFCWIETTYSLVNEWNKTVGKDVPYPGIGNSHQDTKNRVYHKYYQWVWFVLYLQALMFFVPRWIWKMTEEKKASTLVMDLGHPCLKEEIKKDKLGMLIKYFVARRGTHKRYFYWYFICEILNVINVFGQMQLMHRFLGGKFWSFGLDILKTEFKDDPLALDVLIELFPRMTKCTFHHFGPSGDINREEATCLLSINNINEKIYVILWFWFLVLGIMSILAVIYRIAYILSPRLRIQVTKIRCPMARKSVLALTARKISFGDWFLLDRLAKNMDGFNFKELTESLMEELARNDGVYNNGNGDCYQQHFLTELKIQQNGQHD